MLKIARGPAFAADPGDHLDLPDDVGRALVAAGAAEEEVPAPTLAPVAVETTSLGAPEETAVSPVHAPRHHGSQKGGRRK